MLMLDAAGGTGYLGVFLDALTDTAILIPILLAVHLLIELLEVKAFGRLQNNKLLKGNFAPLIGAGVGLLPQCGFSVVAADMYSKKYIRIGTLSAVFIATSDEAISVMLGEAVTDPSVWWPMLQLILIKVIMAVAAGYFLNFIFRKRDLKAAAAAAGTYGCCGHAVVGLPKECELNPDGETAHGQSNNHNHGHDHSDGGAAAGGEKAELHPESKAKHIWHMYFKHPVIHTSIIIGIIFIINMIMGTVIYSIGGEEILAEFMTQPQMLWLQPLLAAVVGLIPNCASSVIIAEMFISGSLTLGAAVSGLAVNAGMGVAILFKENKNIKENLGLLGGLFVFSVAVGYIITAIL